MASESLSPDTLAVVTGANRGIGLELVKRYATRGARVIAACRKITGELAELLYTPSLDGRIRAVEGVDVTHEGGLKTLARAVGSETVSVLICNAGVLHRETIDDLSGDGLDRIRQQFEVNTLGPLRTVHALRERLSEGSKIGIVTSRMGSIGDNTSGGRYGYRMSKAAVNMGGASLAHDLKPKGVAVALLHPGFVQTRMTGGGGDVSADVSAAGLVARLDALTLETSGSFWHAQGQLLPW